jgi:SAM-dependent methyltransferase
MFGFLRRFREWMITPALMRLNALDNAASTRLDQLVSAKLEQQASQLKEIFSSQQSAIEQQLTDLKQQITENAQSEAMLLKVAGLAARSARLQAEANITVPNFKPARPHSFDESLRRLEALNPTLFPVWRELFENGAKSYVEERLGSCSHREHEYARLFGAYLEIYGHGRILDIGCGPYRLPSYLAARKAGMICGVEPLPMIEPAAFEIVRGFNEFLPWDEAQFDTVVSGTSLDHVMSLDVSLQEVRRVLKTKGKYIVWLASIPGAAPFNELSSDFKAIDSFHLFHFDRKWAEPLFEKYFCIDDITIVPQVGFDHVFYCMSPRV